MSLQRNTPPTEAEQNSQPQTAQDRAQILTELRQRLNGLWEQIGELRADTAAQAAGKYEATLVLSTVQTLSEIMTKFTEDTQNELKEMNARQLQTLQTQELYKESVRGEVVKILNNIYAQVEKYQKATLDEIARDTKNTINELKAGAETALHSCNAAANAAGKRARISGRLDNVRDVLGMFSPLLVIICLIIRAIQLFL